jgi:hypothetical protein
MQAHRRAELDALMGELQAAGYMATRLMRVSRDGDGAKILLAVGHDDVPPITVPVEGLDCRFFHDLERYRQTLVENGKAGIGKRRLDEAEARDPDIWPLQLPEPVRRRPPSKRRRQDCMDCGIDTYFATGNGHFYSVHDTIWLTAVPDGRGQLCLHCLEARLDRQLVRADFVATPFEIARRMFCPGWLQAVWDAEEKGVPIPPHPIWGTP